MAQAKQTGQFPLPIGRLNKAYKYSIHGSRSFSLILPPPACAYYRGAASVSTSSRLVRLNCESLAAVNRSGRDLMVDCALDWTCAWRDEMVRSVVQNDRMMLQKTGSPCSWCRRRRTKIIISVCPSGLLSSATCERSISWVRDPSRQSKPASWSSRRHCKPVDAMNPLSTGVRSIRGLPI